MWFKNVDNSRFRFHIANELRNIYQTSLEKALDKFDSLFTGNISDLDYRIEIINKVEDLKRR